LSVAPSIIRAEHVGSLLRPPELKEARAAYRDERLGLEQLREQEDAAVLAVLELQRQVGMEVFTDGEYRRASWLASIRESVGGLVEVDPSLPRQLQWKRGSGEPAPPEDVAQPPIAVGERLSFREPLSSVEASFMAAHSPGRFKVTMASATLSTMVWLPGVTDKVYATPAEMLRDFVDLEIREIQTLMDLGVGWIQLDSLTYATIIDPTLAQATLPAGFDPEAHLEMAVATDNTLIRAARAKRPTVTVGLHFCRGNARSSWLATGGYEPVAERLFGEVEVERFLLEYDSERAGGFEPLRFVPPGKTVVLGLVSTKTPVLESRDELIRRIDQAARYVPLEQLAIGTQCGFASSVRGNLLTHDDQRRKLELVVDTAQKVWG
jgi:5-methyltetrahydropteroyltriglutamate--homocysteine methyltransferase